MDRVMKKSLILALALLLPAFAWGGEPVMGVRNIRWWDADYLTVTWGGDLTPSWMDKQSRDIRQYIISILDSPTRADQKLFWRPTEEPIYVGSRVLAVDGRDARGWHTDRFYDAIESPYRHVLKLEHPAIGEYEVNFGTDFPSGCQYFLDFLFQMYSNRCKDMKYAFFRFLRILYDKAFDTAPVTALASAFRKKCRAVKLHEKFTGLIPAKIRHGSAKGSPVRIRLVDSFDIVFASFVFHVSILPYNQNAASISDAALNVLYVTYLEGM